MSRFVKDMPITDEFLNAYVDGALNRSEAAHVAGCAATNPRIANRIAVLHQIKAGVAGIADDVVVIDTPMPLPPAPYRRHLQAALVTLAFMATVTLSLSSFAPAERPATIATENPVIVSTDIMLERFVGQHDAWIGLAEQAVTTRSFGFWLEDLMAATGLSLVYHDMLSMDGVDQAEQFSFVGPNGCRLSLFHVASSSETAEGLNIMIDGGLLTSRWADAGRSYALVARNMDHSRFATIASVVHDASRDRGSVDAQALASLQQARQPCLG